MKSTNTRKSRCAPFVALSLVAAAALVACGGGGGENAARATPLGSQSGVGSPPPFVPLAEPLPADATEREKHIQMAKITGEMNPDIMYPQFCIDGTQDPALGNNTRIPLTQLFDDFYYVGQVTVGQFVLKTKDGGLVLFDTISNNAVTSITEPELAAGGLDLNTLRGIVVTHGHGDHDGGTAQLQDKYMPDEVVVGSADYNANKPYEATLAVDSASTDPLRITIGGSTFTALAGPGHTAGTTNYIVPVTQNGKTHKIAYLGGSGFPGSAQAAWQYLRSAERMYDLVKAEGADASINSHTFFDKSLARIQKIREEGFANGNPMVQGNAKVLLSFANLRNCSAALLSDRDATARNPVWRPTTTELYAARYNPNGKTMLVKARVSNYFSVLSGGSVQFTSTDGGSCTAVTDSEGIASCVIKGAAAGPVTAEFAGMTSADAVDLTSTDTAESVAVGRNN